MAVERGYLKIYLDRGGYEPFYWQFDEDGTPIDLTATYDDIKIQIREKPTYNSKLIKSLSLSDMTITGTDNDVLQFRLDNNHEGGKYYFDARFKLAGTENWLTLLSGIIIITNNITKV